MYNNNTFSQVLKKWTIFQFGQKKTVKRIRKNHITAKRFNSTSR